MYWKSSSVYIQIYYNIPQNQSAPAQVECFMGWHTEQIGFRSWASYRQQQLTTCSFPSGRAIEMACGFSIAM